MRQIYNHKTMETEKRNTLINNSTLFIGCMFIGLGLGFIFNAVTAGVLIGMGVGFIARSVYNHKVYNQKSDQS